MKKVFAILLLYVSGVSGYASAQGTNVDPSRINWPTGTAGCVYAPGSNTCIATGAAKLQPVVARTVLEGLNKAPSILKTTSQPTNMPTFSFAVKGTFLLSTQGNSGGVTGGLNVSDITDPANPVQVGLFTSSSGSNPTSLSIDATGTYAYVGYYDTDKLDVWNISQLPNAPTLVGSSTLTLSTPISRSVISGNYLYVSSFRGGANTANVYVINIATPSTPSLTGTYTTATGYGAQWVRVSGTTMYISESSTGTGKIEAVSVATPSTPTLLSAVTLPHANQDLVLNGTHAYVGNHDSLNMEIIDISTPSAMVDNGAGSLASSIACAPLGADGGNNTLFFACDSGGQVAVVDVTNPTVPVPLTSITASTGPMETVAAFGRFLFASHYTAFTVDAIDLGNEYNLSAGRMQVAGSNVCTAANGLCGGGGSPGTVTSITFTGDGTVLSATPSTAVTTSGTVSATLANAPANSVLAGPASGGAGLPTYQTVPTVLGLAVKGTSGFAPTAGFPGINLVPGDNLGTTKEIYGSNTANSSYVWWVNDDGSAFFPNMNLTGTIPIGSGTVPMLQIGATTPFADTGLADTATGNINGYLQRMCTNTSSGTAASCDFIVNNNNSTASTYYGDFGINGGNFAGTGSLSLPNATYVSATSGDLVLGTNTANTIRLVANNATTDALDINSSNQVVIPALTTPGVLVNSGTGVVSSTTATGTGSAVLATNAALTTPTINGLAYPATATAFGWLYMSSATQVATTGTMSNNALIKQNTAGGPTNSTLFDYGSIMSTTEALFQGGGSTTLAPASGIGTTATSTGIAFPGTSGATTRTYRGECHIYWEQLVGVSTVTFSVSNSTAVNQWVGSRSVGVTTATSVSVPVNVNATTTTAVTPAMVPLGFGATAPAETELTIITASVATADTITIYAQSGNASDTITILPGSMCHWVP